MSEPEHIEPILKRVLRKINKKQWQAHHQLTDDEMKRLEFILKLFNGKIIKIKATSDDE